MIPSLFFLLCLPLGAQPIDDAIACPQGEARLAQAAGEERLDLLIEWTEACRREDSSRAVVYGTEAIELLTTWPDDARRLRLLIPLIDAQTRQDDYAAAEALGQEARQLAQARGDRLALARALRLMAQNAREAADYPRAAVLGTEAVSVFEELGMAPELGEALIILSRAFEQDANRERRLAILLRAYEILGELGDSSLLAHALNNIGNIYRQTGRYDEALEVLQQALEIAQRLGDEDRIRMVLLNIGVVYRVRGDGATALEYHQRSLAICERIGTLSQKALVLKNIALDYSLLSNFEQMLLYFRQAMSIWERLDRKGSMALSLLDIGMVYQRQNRHEEAQDSFERALEYATAVDAVDLRRNILRGLARSRFELGHYREAYEAQERYDELLQASFDGERNQAIAEMQARFDVERKEKDIALLEERQRVSDLELRQQRDVRLALVVGFTLLLSILLLVFNRFRLNSRQALMTEIVRQEQQASARLREIDQLKDQFLANTSHELRTPLYGITGLAESLIAGATGQLPEATKANLSMIVASGRRLGRLVNDILDHSQLENESLKLDRRPVDLHSLAEIVLTLEKPAAAGKELDLVNAVGSELAAADADEGRLEQILHNLVGNAIKFTEAGRVEVSARQEEDRLVVTVEDTGIGIAEDKQERIFGAFEQGDSGTQRAFGGTGLGLTVTRQLVELHGGEIRVDSAPGEGARFSFTLPISSRRADDAPSSESTLARRLSMVPDPAVSVPEIREDTSVQPGPGAGRILLVDDEPVVLQLLSNQLRSEGYVVELAASGPEALRKLEMGFGLVVLDVMMPKMSGYEVCRTIRGDHSIEELPIIFLTAKSQVPDLVSGLAAGGNDYLTKPILKDELLARVRTHLELAEIHRQLSRVAGDLRARNADLARFNYSVAHDLRNPLVTIANFLSLARHDAAAGRTERLGQDFDLLDEATETLRKLLDDLFELSRVDAEDSTLEDVDLGELVDEALVALADPIARRGVAVDVAEDLPTVHGDRTRLLEVFRHLMTNAVNYFGDQTAPRLEIGARDQRAEKVFYVRDNGIGIDPRYHEKVFELFERLDPESSSGTGVGLTLVKRIIERHGGRIWVESSGRGSAFCFTLKNSRAKSS